jgi:integrase
VIGARWSEVDLDKGLWIVPGERMKSGSEHRVPLSDRALKIISQLPNSEFIFPGRKPDKPLSQQAMLELVRDMRGKGATVHGFRSTFRDWAAEQTSYPNELGEIALAHAIRDKTEEAYRRGDMLEKRQRLMADWAAYCERPPVKGDVTPIRRSA